jgi:hypothetical protein
MGNHRPGPLRTKRGFARTVRILGGQCALRAGSYNRCRFRRTVSSRRPTTCGVRSGEQRCLADVSRDHEQSDVRSFGCAGAGQLVGAAAWLDADDPITKMLRVGVAVHHGRLPDAVRRAVEDDYRSGRIKVLAATTTLGQGVNLPVRTVLVHSVRRRDEDNNETRTR